MRITGKSGMITYQKRKQAINCDMVKMKATKLAVSLGFLNDQGEI